MIFDRFFLIMAGFALIILIVFVVDMLRLEAGRKAKLELLAELAPPRDARGRFVKREAK